MGNRFKALTQYHVLIRAHGIIAAITFLGVVPAAIMLARFYGRSPFWALRLHIWLQVITFLLTTVVFILGFMAVGPERALTNPHHGIGTAIYVLIIWQVIDGWWVHKREKGKRRLHLPLKLMIHQWLGRMIALLGITQVALGLTLYGSPKILFILYSLAVFVLFVAYFILTWMHQQRIGNDYDSRGSYLSGTETDVVDERPHHSRLGRLAAVGAGGAAIAALGSRMRRRSRSRSRVDVIRDDRPPVGAGGGRIGHRPSGSYIDDEKYSEDEHRGGWSRRLLEVGAVAGTVGLARKIFGRRDRDEDSDVGPYRPPLGGNQSYTESSVSRLEQGQAGRPLGTGDYPLNQTPPRRPLGHRRSQSSVSYSSYTSDGSPNKGHGFRNAVAGLGAVAIARNLLKTRRRKKEERRVEDVKRKEIEAERIARANSQRYTGDGPPRRHGRRQTSQSDSTDFTASIHGRNHHHGGAGVPLAAGGLAGVAAEHALSDRNRIRPVGTDPIVQGATHTAPPIQNIPPIPPSHRVDSSGSEIYTSTDGRRHHRHRDEAAAGLGGAALGTAAAEGSSARRRTSAGRHHSTGEDITSQPVSIHIKRHDDGRKVTLRRLTEEEAIAQREARRRDRSQSRHRRHAGSVSSLSGNETGGSNSRWRRTEALERQQAEEIRREQEALTGTSLPPLPISATGHLPPPPMGRPPIPQVLLQQQQGVPPPPPIPSGAGSGVTSPGEVTGTEASADYANNRRRRRAERAQARMARQQAQGVEFS